MLQELIDQTMVQVVKRNYCGKVKNLRVHDIMRDLCIQEAHKLEFLTVLSSEFVQHNEMAGMNSRRTAINLRYVVFFLLFSNCNNIIENSPLGRV